MVMFRTHSEPPCVRFFPSRVEGEWSDVREVVIKPSELMVHGEGGWVTVPFSTIGRRQELKIVSFLKRLVGVKPLCRIVGERDWCRPPTERFFLWFTVPPLKTYMPSTETPYYSGSLFPQIHETLHHGGFTTFDLA
jgi:hypothetical protein